MSGRDHIFNRSTRPLLERKQQQTQHPLLLKKKYVCGFNDFNFVSKQCSNDTYYSGYPYGSPPSPTVINNTDFIFSDDSGIHNTSNLSTNSRNSHHNDDDNNIISCYQPIKGYNSEYPWNVTELTTAPTTTDTVAGTAVQHHHHHHHYSSKQISATKGPFIFGIDTNQIDRYKPTTPHQQLIPNEGSSSVIETKTQYSNDPIKVI